MRLTLKRVFKGDTYTIGKLYIDGVYFCDTLEDKVRKITPDDPKVYGETAILSGIYEVVINWSPRFKCMMPLLLKVAHFVGIRIHWGNIAKDTEGCILVGENKEKGKVLNSKVTYNKLMTILKGANNITIEVV